MTHFNVIHQDYENGPMYAFSSHRSEEAAQRKLNTLINDRHWFTSGYFWSIQATEKNYTARIWEFEDLNPIQITEPKTLPQIFKEAN